MRRLANWKITQSKTSRGKLQKEKETGKSWNRTKVTWNSQDAVNAWHSCPGSPGRTVGAPGGGWVPVGSYHDQEFRADQRHEVTWRQWPQGLPWGSRAWLHPPGQAAGVWSPAGELGSHMPHSQKTKTQNWSTVVTNSAKTLKMVHIKKQPKNWSQTEGNTGRHGKIKCADKDKQVFKTTMAKGCS